MSTASNDFSNSGMFYSGLENTRGVFSAVICSIIIAQVCRVCRSPNTETGPNVEIWNHRNETDFADRLTPGDFLPLYQL